VRRINVSLDSLDAETYRRLTRGGDLAKTLAGIDAALAAGLKLKINVVALKDDNADELADLIAWAHGRGMDASLIETMPLGEIEQDRTEQYLPLSVVRDALQARWTLEPLTDRTGGPSRYVRVAETGGRLGFITPLSHNFCAACNRVRVTCTGTLFLCLGREEQTDLRAVLRAHPDDDAPVRAAILEAMTRKPERHDFRIERYGQKPALARPMSMTGG
jgi:cyclic pyranopterin phosphate synthase